MFIKWFWTIFSLGAPVSRSHSRLFPSIVIQHSSPQKRGRVLRDDTKNGCEETN